MFLDEIGNLPLALQAKILRALEERRFERVGGTQSLHVDVRIVAATNKQLRAGVAAKQFREDLYFRLSVLCDRLYSGGPSARHIAIQVVRCGTSIGANAEEAQEGQTKADFIAEIAGPTFGRTIVICPMPFTLCPIF